MKQMKACAFRIKIIKLIPVMKQKILFCTLAVLTALFTFAQDIIITNDARKINAKILEVSKSEIRYEEKDNIDGPTFIMSINDINSIIYANGKVVIFDHQKDNGTTIIASGNTSLPEITGRSANQTEIQETGSIAIGGNSCSLEGRDIISLPRPSTNYNEEGKVIIEVHVNPNGEVCAATHKGGTVTDKQTIQIALDAARKAKFSKGDHEQIGTITYTFKLN